MSDSDLTKLKRDELNELATEAGVPDPEELPNKEAVVDAIEAPNPALVIDTTVEPVEKTYKVTGIQPVMGYEPGTEFTAVIPIEQEGLLLGGGHITENKES